MKNGIRVTNHDYAGLTELWSCTGEVDAQFHRIDGPALIWDDGFIEWYIDGNFYQTFEAFFLKAKLTEEEKLIVRIKYPQFRNL